MSDMALECKLRPFTVDEFHRLAEIGVLRVDERVELLAGTLVEMSPIGSRHWGRHVRLVEYLIRELGERAAVAGQASLPLGEHDEPQPDIAVLARRLYEPPHPLSAPADIYAVVELSDTSLPKDIGPKLRVYARHRIADYLVVDLNANVLLHYGTPNDVGYAACDELHGGDVFTLAALGDIRLDVAAFLEPDVTPRS